MLITSNSINMITHNKYVLASSSESRKKILEDTSKHGVEFGLHYPMPIHRQKAFKTHPQYRSKFNNADTFSNQLLSLPIFPKMKDREIERVIEVVSEYAVS